jgi:ubiquinone/menaquinone biosynthesis C-methylase UbiE
MEQYVIRGGHDGYERLRLLARAWLPYTSGLFDRIGIAPGWRCLDLGCGGGEVTFEIARRVGPTGSVTGIDMDEVKLDLGRASAADQGLRNVDFQTLNVYDWHAPEAYDLVYCRCLLQHLSRPVDVLRAMWSAVKPGGVIVVEDADFAGAFCYPPNDGFDFHLRTYCQVLERRGGDPAVGRKLYGYALEAGIPEPILNVVQRVDNTGEAKTLTLSTLDATADPVLAEGLATAAELSAALASLSRFTDDPTTIIGLPRHFQLWRRR